MKNNRINFAVFLVTLLIMSVDFIYAQDTRVPGGEQKAPLGANVRNGKLFFGSEDGNFAWWFDSRLQIDGAMYFENKNQMSNGTVLRRLTFALKAVLWKDWQAEFDVDFGEDVSVDPQTSLRDMWVKYTFPSFNLALQAGNFKDPFGMENLNSSRLLTFLERTAITNALRLSRRVGISARYWNDYGQVTAAVMGHEPGTRKDKGQQDEGWSSTLRLSVAPINNHGENLHFGFAGSYKIPDVVSDLPTNTIEISARTETYVFNPKFLHSDDITDVNYYNRYGAELMYVNGPFYLQSEFMGAMVKRWDINKKYSMLNRNPNIHLKGGYVMATYMLTGETRYYYIDEGEVGPIEAPKNSWGAIELAARYSVTNLNDLKAGIIGGQSNQLMLGVNYYPNTNIKLQFNYSYVNLDQYANRKGNLIGDDDHSFIQMRIQASL